MVLDHKSRKLLFYRFWFSFRPNQSLDVDDIDALSWRHYDSPGSYDDPGYEYHILVARLRDGRHASIAIDSPRSIEVALKQAIGHAD